MDFIRKKRFYYRIKLQYLGFRFHGWQKQPGLKTVEKMVLRTLKFVLKERPFKILATGRTDALVSVNQTYIELFIKDRPLNLPSFFNEFNENLPQDIRALAIEETTEDFNIIQHAKQKEYHYYFCFGEKYHPFAAPFMTNIQGELDIQLMCDGAKLFEGEHDFRAYAFRAKPQTQTRGNIFECELVRNDILKANFFPEESYVLKIVGEGFKRHQIRLMMGALFLLGKREITLDYIKNSLYPEFQSKLTYIAPASGLVLYKVDLKEEI